MVDQNRHYVPDYINHPEWLRWDCEMEFEEIEDNRDYYHDPDCLDCSDYVPVSETGSVCSVCLQTGNVQKGITNEKCTFKGGIDL